MPRKKRQLPPQQTATEPPYQPYGGVREAWLAREREILVEGPAGTGKSRGILEWLLLIADGIDPRTNKPWPWLEGGRGLRIAIVRRTRTSLSLSTLVTLEEKVFKQAHAYLLPPYGPGRSRRLEYRFKSGSVMVPFGVDDPGKHHSTEWDIVFVDEATDLTEDQWERFHRSLRWNQLPWQQLIGACNPGAAWHWLNQRCNRGLCRRIVTVHGDNPTNTPEYLAALDRKQTGVRRDRLFLGKWTNAEGLILNTYRADKHLISIVKRGDDYARIEYDKDGDPVEKNLGIKGYFGSIDWGTRAPGVFQVWGQDAEKRLYMLVEVYRQGRDPVWWTDVIADLVERHRIYAVVADPEDAGRRDMLNDRLQQKGMGRIVRPADNRWEAGIELLRSAFARDMLFINRDALLDGPDPELKAVAAPCSTPDELESYVFYKGAPGWTEIQRVKYERPDPACADHGCDTTRYAGMFGWQNQVLSESTEDVMARRSLADVTYPPGSLGDVLGHREFWAEQRRKELAGERDIDEESLDRFARSLLR